MNKYELVFVVDVTLGDDKVKEIVDKFKNLIEESATIENLDEWGKKKLAYEIDYKSEGYYVFVEFSAKPDFPQELERVFKITEGIMRYLVIKQNV